MARRPIFLAIIAAATVAIVVPITVFGLPAGGSDPEAFSHVWTNPANGNTTQLHVDADPTNGTSPCAYTVDTNGDTVPDDVDRTHTVQVGDTYDVALCLESYAPNKVESFKLRLYYDDINTAQTVECGDGGGGGEANDALCVDANPDANSGNDATGFKLGGGWDCTGLGALMPLGDDPNTPCEDEFGQPIYPCLDAIIACNANLLAPDLDLAANPGLLATVEFTATDVGTELLTWGSDTEVGGADVNLPDGGFAHCGADVPEEQIGCFGATIDKVVFDCVWEDSFGRGTYLGLLGNDWIFGSPEGTFSGTGRVMRFGDRAFMLGRGEGFSLGGFGTCPSGPGTAFGLSSVPPLFLRVQDVGEEAD